MNLLRSLYDVILDGGPEDLVAAVGCAVMIAVTLSGAYALLRHKAEDRVMLVTILVIFASVTSMGLGAGYVASFTKADWIAREGARRTSIGLPMPASPPGPLPPWPDEHGPGPNREGMVGDWLSAAADDDRDGRLTPEEVVGFARSADQDGNGAMDSLEFVAELRRREPAPPKPGEPPSR